MKNWKNVLSLLALILGVLFVVPAVSRADMMDKGRDKMGTESTKAETAINGFCPVCVIHGMAMKGSDHFVTEYKGKLYKFVGFKEQKMFIEDPEQYIKDLDVKFQELKK